MITRILLLGLSVFISACASGPAPEVQTGPGAEVIQGGLHRVDNTRSDAVYLDPNADWSRYTSVMLDALAVDKVKIIAPDTRNSVVGRAGKSQWTLSDKDKLALQQAFANSMKKQLEENGGYPIVDSAGDNVLHISAVLTALAPTATPDTTAGRGVGRGRVYTEGAGTVYIAIGFADSQTGEVLGLMKDGKQGSTTWGVNNSVSNMGDVRFVFNRWAVSIRAWLDNNQGK